MFKLNQKYEIKKINLNCDFIRYSPSQISTINTANSQMFINIPRENSDISLLNSYLDLNLMYYMLPLKIDTQIKVI